MDVQNNEATQVAEVQAATGKVVPPRRPRFALSSLVWAVLLFGTLIFLFFSVRETRVLRAENQKLKEQYGALIVKDRNLVYARSVKSYQEKAWIWRVYLPKPGKYRIGCTTKSISVSEPSKWSGGLVGFFDAGEHEIHAWISKSLDGNFQIQIEHNSSNSIKQSIPASDAGWLANGSYSWDGVREQSAQFKPGDRIELIRLREMEKQPNGASVSSSNPVPGLNIFLEPDK